MESGDMPGFIALFSPFNPCAATLPMMNEPKLFTVAEANALIPQLEDHMARLREKREEILKMELEIDTLEILSEPVSGEIPPQMDRKVEAYNRLVAQFYERVDQVHATGGIMKDVDSGLVDFYASYHGRMIFLCWKSGEAAIEGWHEIGRGFIHRKPLEPDMK